MRDVIPPCSGKAINFNSLHNAELPKSARNRVFPPLTDPEWLGLTAIIAWPLIVMLLATLGDLRCHPGDRNTINGRDLCPTEKAP